MRRDEREIIDISAMEAIIHASIVCRLALSDKDQPYIVPLCFGYKDKTLYFHCAPEGRKIDIIKKNHNVCFEFDVNTEVVKAEKACNWGMKYQSVIGFGKAVIVESLDEKRKAIDIIMSQYVDRVFQFPDPVIKGAAVIKVEIEKMTGKQSGF